MEKGKPLMHKTIRPERVLALGFLGMILVGSVVLALPAASSSGESMGLFNSLFTATSAVCVTGLVAVNTGTALTRFGQAVLLVLIQLGGLGFMIFATLIMQALGRRISLKGQVLIRESLNVSTLSGLLRLSRWYGLMALGLEGAGTALLAIRMIPRYGPGLGLWYAVFHSVSAFCNAGFDLMGGFGSLTSFATDPLVLLTIAGEIILGGLGFSVLLEVWQQKGRGLARLSLHTKVVLTVSLLLLAGGTLFYALVEWNNPQTLASGDASPGVKLLNAFFQSVTMRTAGFSTVALSELRDSSKLMSVILMFIGASPASTGGGVKTTTISVLVLIVLSVVRGEDNVNIFGKRLPHGMMRRALSILFIDLCMLLAGTMVLTLAEGDGYPLIDLLMEAASALATVGLSSIGTPQLTLISRATLCCMMYFGRVGPLTMAFALASRQERVRDRLRYPEEDMMLG